MGAKSGDYSSFKFDEEKKYAYPLFQKSTTLNRKILADADFNEGMQALYRTLQRTNHMNKIDPAFAGDSFKILESATDNTNNFLVTGRTDGSDTYDDDTNFGMGMLHGILPVIFDDQEFESNSIFLHRRSSGLTATILTDSSANYDVNELVGRTLYPNVDSATGYTISANTATTITISSGDMTTVAEARDRYRVGLSTPSATRTDKVLLDVYLNEISTDDDSSIAHSVTSGGVTTSVESARRNEIEQCVWVKENYTSTPDFTYTDSDGNIHYVAVIATLTRNNNDTVLTAEITDERDPYMGSSAEVEEARAGYTSLNARIAAISGGSGNPVWISVGDGVNSTGDYTLISDALSALPATGGVILVKHGVYDTSLIPSAITINKANVTILGEGGKASKLIPGALANIFDVQEKSFTLQGCWIDGQNLTDHAVKVTGSESTVAGLSILDNVWENCTGIADLSCTSKSLTVLSYNFDISGNFIADDNPGVGGVGSVIADNLTRLRFHNNWITTNAAATHFVLQLNTVDHIEITGNQLRGDDATSGVAQFLNITDCNYITIDGNILQGPGTSADFISDNAIYLDGNCDTISISNNRAYGLGDGRFLYIDSATLGEIENIQVTDNLIHKQGVTSPAPELFKATNARAVRFSGNFVRDITSPQAFDTQSGDDIEFENNVVLSLGTFQATEAFVVSGGNRVRIIDNKIFNSNASKTAPEITLQGTLADVTVRGNFIESTTSDVLVDVVSLDRAQIGENTLIANGSGANCIDVASGQTQAIINGNIFIMLSSVGDAINLAGTNTEVVIRDNHFRRGENAVNIAGAGCDNLSVSGNIFYDPVNCLVVSGAQNYVNMNENLCVGNSLLERAIYCATSSDYIDSLQFCGNNVINPLEYAIDIDTVGDSGEGGLISGNHFECNSAKGVISVADTARTLSFCNNVIDDAAETPVYIATAINCDISNNAIYADAGLLYSGVRIETSGNQTKINSNIIIATGSTGTYLIYVNDFVKGSINDNILDGARVGVYIGGDSWDSTINGNKINNDNSTSASHGIYVFSLTSEFLTVSNNNIENCYYGIRTEGQKSVYSGNIVSNANASGETIILGGNSNDNLAVGNLVDTSAVNDAGTSNTTANNKTV